MNVEAMIYEGQKNNEATEEGRKKKEIYFKL